MRLIALLLVIAAGPALAAAPQTSLRPLQGPEVREVLGCTVWRPNQRGYWVKTDPSCEFTIASDDGSTASGARRPSITELTYERLSRVRED